MAATIAFVAVNVSRLGSVNASLFVRLRPCLGVSAVRLVLPALAMTMTTTASLSVAARRHINDVAGMTSFAVVKGIALATATTTIMIVAGEAAW